MKSRLLVIQSLAFLLCLAGLASSALAFPSWMGVYGDDVRHTDESNPGTFTILMNQDYLGLHAEVGIQVNGGSWTVYQMSYAGKKDNNSKWTLTPASAFPAGATVKYYFHGYDNWGGNIWDTNNGSNYTFTTAAGNQGVIEWDQGVSSPLISHMTVDSNTVHALSYDYDTAELKYATRVLPDGAWSAWRTVVMSQYLFSTKVAAKGATVLIQFADAGVNKLLYSSDGGATFSSPVDLGLTGSVLGLHARSATEFYLLNAYDSGGFKLDFRKSTDAGKTWSAATQIASFPASSAYPGLTARIGSNAGGIYVAYSYSVVDSRQFGTGTHYGAASADGGATWDIDQLQTFDIVRGNGTTIAALVTDSDAFIASSAGPGAYPNNGPATVWKRSGTGWTAHALPDHSSGNQIFLARAPGGEIVLIDGGTSGYGAVYAVSLDNGETFGGRRDLTLPTGMQYVNNIATAVASPWGIHLLWSGINTEPTYENVMSWQTGVAGRVGSLQWIGNTYHWPPDGELDAGDPLWINVETYPAGAANSALVVYSPDGGTTWLSAPMEFAGQTGQNDSWHVNLSWLTTPGVVVRYAVMASDGVTELWDNHNGADYFAHVTAPPSVQWAGNVWHWPPNGQLTSTTDFWVNVESWPRGAAVYARVVYTTNGGATWNSRDLEWGGQVGNNDWWHLNLGKFPSRTTIRYAVEVRDPNGKSIWANNNGADYYATVK
jgi:hypothetical protein